MDQTTRLTILFAIIQNIQSASNGLSTGEIATKYGVSPRTASNYVRYIQDMGIPVYDDKKRWYIDSGYFVPFTLTVPESEFLYLALQRSITYETENWSIVHSLVRKLTSKMADISGDRLFSEVDWDRGELKSARLFAELAGAKANRYEVIVSYLPLRREDISQWRIRPYRFVVNPLSDGFYIICEGSQDGQSYQPLSLKFDRIMNLTVTREQYEIADLARFKTMDGRSWGVWHSDQEPQRVHLQFELRHYNRLLETIWHPSQVIHVTNDDYVHFEVYVSEPNEMVPWIRSWGSGVVVLEPQSLRDRILKSLMKQLRNYGLQTSTTDSGSPIHQFWAKYDRRTTDYHLLMYHLLEVGAVAVAMWHNVLSTSTKIWLCHLLDADDEQSLNLIALLVALHDIGKATPAFQSKADLLYKELDPSLQQQVVDVPHGVLSTYILRQWLIDKGMKPVQVNPLASAIGGHHGAWITHVEAKKATGAVGSSTWITLQHEICDTLENLFGVKGWSLPQDVESLNIFTTFLSGFISVCDWIGSNDTYFPYDPIPTDYQAYLQGALNNAEQALSDLGWYSWLPDRMTNILFDRIFGFNPNTLQQTAIQLFAKPGRVPRLILVEYLTGSGKTELALYLSDLLMNLFDLVGVYVAMPTQATSNQMFGRVAKYLEKRYPHHRVNLQLIHGQADHHHLYKEIQIQPNRDGNESGVVANKWFQNRKRALLSPYAVGTIDQAMLSVLQVNHHFVRQFALSQKIIIFDEIHSYDTYMNTIIDRLLEWLCSLQSPMIMLSATLSNKNRMDMLNAVHADVSHIQEVPYPRLTIVDNDGTVHIHPLPKPDLRTIHINHINCDLHVLTDTVASIYQHGGCIAVICNTVNESIDVARYLRHHSSIEPDDVMLFHARYPPIWRKQIEDEVLELFGKNGERPTRMILVSTQIIEQSLDLDFDLMISRTAPIDLLIQRMGRLHRHNRDTRPAHLRKPVLIIREPVTDEQSVPSFEVDEFVYDRFLLLRTWWLLRDMHDIRIPDDIDPVMNFVYSEQIEIEGADEAYQIALQEAHQEMHMENTRSNFAGTQRIIGAPDDSRLIGQHNWRLSDDDNHNIATRQIQPAIDIICIMDGRRLEITTRKPSRNEVTQLLQLKIAVRHRETKQAIEQLPEIVAWQHTQLQYARPIVFVEGVAEIPNSRMILRLSHDYGLEIVMKEE